MVSLAALSRRVSYAVRVRLGLPLAPSRVITFGPNLRVWADSRDLVERELVLTGVYEPAVARVMRAVLEPGDTAIDVGAHVGLHSLYAAALVGRTGSVVAVEPNHAVAERLR